MRSCPFPRAATRSTSTTANSRTDAATNAKAITNTPDSTRRPRPPRSGERRSRSRCRANGRGGIPSPTGLAPHGHRAADTPGTVFSTEPARRPRLPVARKRHIRPFRPRFGGFESLLPQQGVFAALRASVPNSRPPLPPIARKALKNVAMPLVKRYKTWYSLGYGKTL